MVDIDELIDLSATLTAGGITHALGGSGLLMAHGAVNLADVNDWDVTTDSDEADVAAALAGYDYRRLGPSGRFRTEYLMQISLESGTADLMGRFAIAAAGGTLIVPTVVRGRWRGVPLGDVRTWAAAYRAMGRPRRAQQAAAAPSSR